MIGIMKVRYLGLEVPRFAQDTNATLCTTENCGVVLKDCMLSKPMDRMAKSELEKILSTLFGCTVQISTQEVVPVRSLGPNPEGEIT